MLMDKILLMLQLQLQLNDATNGEKWREGFTKTGNPINWRRCIYMECAEMIDSFSWKHWKNLNQAPDWDNLQIEVVDVWHFIISLALEEYAKQMKGEIEDLAISLDALPNFSALHNKNVHHGAQDEVIAKVENIMLLALQKESFEIEEIVAEFFDLVLLSGLDIDTLYRLYVGKNILNQFRQDYGYKDGTYIKEWDGQEDNVVMKRLWDEDADMKPEVLYKKMAKIYLPLTER
jgi:hypothetical protein